MFWTAMKCRPSFNELLKDGLDEFELECQREHGNATDMYAVAVIKDSTIAWADIEDVSGPLGSGRQSTGFIYRSRAIFSNSS